MKQRRGQLRDKLIFKPAATGNEEFRTETYLQFKLLFFPIYNLETPQAPFSVFVDQFELI